MNNDVKDYLATKLRTASRLFRETGNKQWLITELEFMLWILKKLDAGKDGAV